MGWNKSGKEYVWGDLVTDIRNDKIIIALIKTVCNSVLNDGYINDGQDLHRIAGYMRPLVIETRADLVGLSKTATNRIGNVLRYFDNIENGTVAENQANLHTVCTFVRELLVTSGYNVGNT